MKIAIFTDCYLDLTGGIVSSINADKAELERRGHLVYVFSSGYPRSKREKQKLARQHIFPVKSCRVFGRGLTPIARRPGIIEKELEREHPEIREFDVFYVHYEAGCSIAGLRMARKYGVKSIQVMHGREDMGEDRLIPLGLKTIVATLLNWFHSWYIPHPVKVRRDDYLADTIAKAKMWTLMTNHANYADLAISPSEHFRTKLKHYGVTKPFEVLPHGLSDVLCSAPIKERQIGPEEPVRMIWHSRLSSEKRIMEFLEALKILDEANFAFTLDVYGDGADAKKATKYAKRHHLPVNFHGNTPHEKVWQELLMADLDILASYNYDNYSMALVEAVVAGVPTFIADPDMEEILPIGGYVMANDPSPAGMAKALAEIFKEPGRIERMSFAVRSGREAKKISKKIDKFERLVMEEYRTQ